MAFLQHREVLVHALDIGDDVLLVGAGDGPQLQVFLHRHGGEGAAALRHMRDTETDDVFGRASGKRLALELDGAGRTHHVADRAQGGGLAGAVGAQQGGETTFVKGKAQAVQRLDLAVIGAEILDVEHRGHWSLLPRWALMTSGSAWTWAGVPSASLRPKLRATTWSAIDITRPMWCSTRSTVMWRSSRMRRIRSPSTW